MASSARKPKSKPKKTKKHIQKDSSLAAQIFTGTSEMAKLMRSTNWAKTKLGPLEKWPASLRTMIGVVLGSRFPMLIWWGPDLLHLYNDAYRPILRDKHPASLAAPAPIIWAEVWDAVKEMVRGVQEDGVASWMEDLQLFITSGKMAEETYFTFSYSPIPGDDGKVGGLLNTVQESTVKVQGERQIRMLHDLAARAAEAKSEEEAYRIVAEVLGDNPLDLPFTFLYKLDEDAALALLAGSSGWKGYEGPAKPARMLLAEGNISVWPLAGVLRTGQEKLVEGLSALLGELPLGAWNAKPEKAVILPLTRLGQTAPYAFLIAGVSPHRELDERYRRFFRATANQVMTVIANARAYEEEKKRAEALAEIDRAKTAFFANVSHELRTPLTLILAPLESLLASNETPASQKETLRMAQNNAVRLLQMVNGLLDFSKLSAEKMQVKREPVRILDLTRSLFWDFKPVMEQKGIQGDLSANMPEVFVEMDRYMYERILFNLVSNAVKFTPRGGKVTLSAEWDDGQLILSVKDTGIGISEEDQKNLFQRFHQAESSSIRRFEGTGLGLAMVKEFASLLDGSVSVHSRGGGGSTFTVILSAPKASAAPKAAAEPEKPKSAVSLGVQTLASPSLSAFPKAGEEGDPDLPKVLVAEDNPELAHFISRLLSDFCRVQTAPDGEEALEKVRLWGPDLVLSDVMMPRMDGIQLTKEIKGHKETAFIPVVLLTAMTGREALMKGWEAGADDYLFKPFHPKELEARIKSLLSMVQWRQKSRAYRKQRDALEQFTHIASHDLREPLRKIVSFTRLFEERVENQLDEESASYLGIISKSSIHMMQLLDSLMEYSRLDKEATALEKAPLQGALERVLDRFAPDIKQCGARVTAGDLPALRAVPEQIELVFQNLIGNCLKYKSEKAAPEIRVGAVQRGSEWVFSVEDNGIGFDPAHAEKIFIMFERLHGREKYNGDGMGLAICRKIVENHGGRIWAESKPGEGSAFRFTLLADRGE